MTGLQSTALEAHEQIRNTVLDTFDSDAIRVQPALFQPAADLLAHYGETIRGQACTYADAHGRELFLVPDYTVPICRMHLDRGGGSSRYVYAGPIFRPPTPGDSTKPIEEFQAGLEIFGDQNPVQTEIEVFCLAIDAINRTGAKIEEIVIGDTTLGPAVISTLPVSEHRRRRLENRLGHPDRMYTLLRRFTRADPQKVTPEWETILTRFRKAENLQAETLAILEEQKIPLVGQRSAEEIGIRLQELAIEHDAIPMTTTDSDQILSLLPSLIPYTETPEWLSKQAKNAEVNIDPALDRLTAQRNALVEARIDLSHTQFNAWLGHDLGYYDGFVFEIFAKTPQGRHKIASGGRYDRLPQALGGAMPAIGVAVWTERILDCLET